MIYFRKLILFLMACTVAIWTGWRACGHANLARYTGDKWVFALAILAMVVEWVCCCVGLLVAATLASEYRRVTPRQRKRNEP